MDRIVKVWIGPMVFFALMALATLVLFVLLRQNQSIQLKTETEVTATQVKVRVENFLSARIGLIGQMVNLVRDGAPVRMSKRAGTVITLDDLVEALGVDAARYALIRSSVDTPIDIDLELWSSASAENPVYYVQYAHARLCALARNAADLGLAADTSRLGLLSHDKEGSLIRTLGEFPRVLASAASLREPHRVCRYLEDLAGDYHRFYDVCRVLPQGDDQPSELHGARLALCESTRQVIANGLAILGVSAPERM